MTTTDAAILSRLEMGRAALIERNIEQARRLEAEKLEIERRNALFVAIVLERLPEAVRPYATVNDVWRFSSDPTPENVTSEVVTILVPGLVPIRAFTYPHQASEYHLPELPPGAVEPYFTYRMDIQEMDINIALAQAYDLALQAEQNRAAAESCKPPVEYVSIDADEVIPVDDGLVDLVRDLVREQLEELQLI